MKYLWFPLVCVLLTILFSCKTTPKKVENPNPVSMAELDARWKKVDSLEQKGLIADAMTLVESIRKDALASQHSGHIIKSILYINKYNNQLEEDAAIAAIQRGEADLQLLPEPARSVMHSLLAGWYHIYLQRHLWQLRNTSDYAGPAGDDMRTWGKEHFIAKILQHYKASVDNPVLQTYGVEAYSMLLTDGIDTDDLRPTLYDILIHRALDFFTGTETYLTKPVYGFTLTDPIAFAESKVFVQHAFASQDTMDNTWQAVQWFQQLLDFRLKDTEHKGALLDADLKRLQFVYNQIVIDNKDSLYEDALQQLAHRHANLPESALVNYYIAQLWIQQGNQWPANKENGYQKRLREAKTLCEQTIEKFPDTYGSKLCKTLLNQLGQVMLSGSIESIQLPKEDILVHVAYKNIASAYIKLIRLPESPRRWKNENWDGEKILGRLNQLAVVRSWTQPLSATDDLQPHDTEIALPSMSSGHYALMMSDKDDFDAKASTSGVMFFTVSELAYWYMNNQKEDARLAVLHRKTGQPLSGVSVEFITFEYNSGLRKQQEKSLGTHLSDKDGWVNVPSGDNRNIAVRLSKGDDELYTDDNYYAYRYGGNETGSTTLVFMDRAIYRPGQKAYFKGYLVNFDQQQIPTIVANKKVSVVLYDANGQEVTKQTLVSNAYGTIAGQFDLPSGGLTGQMYINIDHGPSAHYFQVEEYKRPKFEVTFDTLKETVRLDEDVTITALSKDFAGSVVSGAMVGYRVERVRYIPWWFGYWGRKFAPIDDERQVIAVGQGMTDEHGAYPITFPARSKPGDHMQSYRFEITVFVTDITGESHEATKVLEVNKEGYTVMIDVRAESRIDQLKKVMLTATNSDGAKVNVNGTVEVALLKGPEQTKRNRLWEVPDVLSLSSAEYEAQFPDYFLPGSEDPATWKVASNAGSKSVEVKGEGFADLSAFITTPGYYRFTWQWRDADGKTSSITQHIYVYKNDDLLPPGKVLIADWDDRSYGPGEKVNTALLTSISKAPKTIILTAHRNGTTSYAWNSLPDYLQSRNVTDVDRGGIIVQYLTVYNNRFFQEMQVIRVPWTNKELSVQLKTWRDKLEPGDNETWSLSVTGDKGAQTEAELLLSMYDASLDAFMPHEWSMSLYPSSRSRWIVDGADPVDQQFWSLSYHFNERYEDVPVRQYRDLNTYGYYPEGYYGGVPRGGRNRGNYEDGVMLEAVQSVPMAEQAADAKAMKLDKDEAEAANAPVQPKNAPSSPPPLRTALDETVFFFPQVMTDDKGQLTFNFKMKEGLTRWKFQALAHTKDLAYGLTKEEVVTQKQLMVFPNPPRFFRAGDTIDFQIKVTNVSEGELKGISKLAIIDAFTDEDVSMQWHLKTTDVPVSIKKGGSTAYAWTLEVPRDWIRPVKYRVYAQAGEFTDGEEALLPVVTNRVLITETLPLPVKADEHKTFVFSSMIDNRSATLKDHQFVVEMTSSPAWYAVQALPYLMEYPHECSEQTFNRLYANTLASFIATKNPAIQKVYEAWRKTGDDALLSNLQKNQELKSAMLEETPWVRDAMSEEQQKKDIAILFESNRLSMETRQALDKLTSMQLGNGGFSWFVGGPDNWYITQNIVEGFGHLQKLGVSLNGANGMPIVQRAVPYLDARMIEWYDDLKRLEKQGKLNMADHQIGSIQVHYVYTRSFFPDINHNAKLDEVLNYVKSQIEKYWLQHGIYEQGLMALGSNRMWAGDQMAKDILASLRQRTIVHEELGRYWKMPQGFYWYESPIETQALMIELYQDMKVAQPETDELRVWLLKQKQTTRWSTTKATSAAIYALLIHPDSWLSNTEIVEVKLGGKTIISNNSASQAGTGYVKVDYSGNEIEKNFSEITVNNPNHHIAWGAAYWQYWEDIDQVKSAVEQNPLKVTRTFLIAKRGDRGEQTQLVDGSALHVGDKLIVRLTVETDRTMDYVHLKDLRASGFEPMDVISGYSWSGGIGYYQSTKDLATHFFIDRLPRGKYVIEYPVTVAQAGSYSAGLATLQCMYAPEYSDHSVGSRVEAGRN